MFFNCFNVIPSQPVLILAGQLSIILGIGPSLISWNWKLISEFLNNNYDHFYLYCFLFCLQYPYLCFDKKR